MSRPWLVVWLCVCFGSLVAASDEVSDRATRRLSPSAFEKLPSLVRIEAEHRGCSVPQSGYDPARGKHNAIAGRFRDPRITAWAVLCSRERVSAILVCNARVPLRCEELAMSPDRDWLQYLGGDGLDFSRLLLTASAGEVRDGVTLVHDGIEDYFEGKASVVWYWESGQWRRLMGKD